MKLRGDGTGVGKKEGKTSGLAQSCGCKIHNAIWERGRCVRMANRIKSQWGTQGWTLAAAKCRGTPWSLLVTASQTPSQKAEWAFQNKNLITSHLRIQRAMVSHNSWDEDPILICGLHQFLHSLHELDSLALPLAFQTFRVWKEPWSLLSQCLCTGYTVSLAHFSSSYPSLHLVSVT